MDLVVTVDNRYNRTPDGAVWSQAQYTYSFWMPYLSVFERVRVVGRVREVATVPSDWKRADGERVSIAPVPHYLGPWQYLLQSRQVQRAARNAVGKSDAVILRVCSSQIALCVEPLLHQTNHPYGLEVVGDPYDIFAPGAVRHSLSPFFRWWFPRQLRRQCAGATAVAYVTEHALQRRYPPAQNIFSTHYSDVELPDSAFVSAPRSPRQGATAFTLVTVGSLAQMYKAPDVLIDAVAACVQEGLNLKLVLIGDGKHRAELEARVAKLGLGKRICFRGQLTVGEPVRRQLDQADVFVLPSKTEGLPRAMLEAMARGLPCIGSTVGGIPELLLPEDIVPPGDVAALAYKIRQVVTDSERMARMSDRNLEKAKEYREEALYERRKKFYRYVQEVTEEWLKAQKQ